MRTIPKMCPEYVLAFLDLVDFNSATKVWIVTEGVGGCQDRPDGSRVFTKSEVHHIWKDEDIQKLRTFDVEQWRYIRTLEVQWEDKSIFVMDYMTTISLRGFNSVPDIKSLPGEPPQKIILNL